MNKKRILELLAVVLIFIIVWFGMKWYKTPGVKSGTEAPSFSSSMPDGKTLSLNDLKGYWVLIDFWGSWCGPCRAANKTLVQLYRQYKEN